MADCYFHGQSAPGPCYDCIREGKEVVIRGSSPSGEVRLKGRINSEASFRLDIQALDISRSKNRDQ